MIGIVNLMMVMFEKRYVYVANLHDEVKKYYFLILIVFLSEDLPYFTLILYLPTLSLSFNFKVATPFLLVLDL